MIKEHATYICDACGKEIKTQLFDCDLVKVEYDVFRSNGWNEWREHQEKHFHKRCFRKGVKL